MLAWTTLSSGASYMASAFDRRLSTVARPCMAFRAGYITMIEITQEHYEGASTADYVPARLAGAFIPAFNQIPCKYRANQHQLQRLRLCQPAFTPIHTHHRSTGGGGGQTMTMPRGGG